MATHSTILAWRIPWTEEPGELQSKSFTLVKELDIKIYANPIYFLLCFWKSYSLCLDYNTTISLTSFFLCLHLLWVSPTEREASNCQKLLYSHLSSPAMTITMVSTCEFSISI